MADNHTTETPIQDWVSRQDEAIERAINTAVETAVAPLHDAIQTLSNVVTIQNGATGYRRDTLFLAGICFVSALWIQVGHPLLKLSAKAANNTVSTAAAVVTGTGVLENRQCIAMTMPSQGQKTSSFGPRLHPVTGEEGKQHNGVDLSAGEGASVFAADSGKVTKVNQPADSYGDGYGNSIEIYHGKVDGHEIHTFYGHLLSVSVKEGDLVSPGQEIAKEGNTGMSTGAHLHFEVLLNGEPVDPEEFLGKKWGKDGCQ